MSGIYLHIPFCKQACTYCDFYFSVSQIQKGNYIKALKKEIRERKVFFGAGEKPGTIYFGGGTPSVLTVNEISGIIHSISESFDMSDVKEITLECNPDDLSEEYLKKIEDTSINRLSVGVQSFFDPYLKLMNRRHDSKKAIGVLEQIKKSAFTNFSVDIIFGIPGQSSSELQKELQILRRFDIPHISIYQLTYEPGTQLDYKIKKGRVGVLPQEEGEKQYNLIIEFLENNGYEHYEVSNFAKPGMYSKHNSLYWKGKKYLGLGASAHSYNGSNIRRWNYSSIKKYIRGLEGKNTYFEEEILDDTKMYNEIVLTRLRTMWGIEEQEIKKHKHYHYFMDRAGLMIQNGVMQKKDSHYKFTKKGMLIADKMIEELFLLR